MSVRASEGKDGCVGCVCCVVSWVCVDWWGYTQFINYAEACESEKESLTVLLFVRVWEVSTGLGMRHTNQTPFHVKYTFPPSLGYFPLFVASCFVFSPPPLMKLARNVSTLYVFWCPCLGSPSVEKQTQARCLPLMFPAGRPYSISIQQTNI